MEAVIQISEVNGKDVSTSRGVGTVYSIRADDGREFSTFKKPLSEVAGQLRGQAAVITYRESPWQKGEKSGVNLYLDGIKAAEGLTEAPGGHLTGQQLAGIEAHSPGFDPPMVQTVKTGVVSHNFTYKDDKSAQINRSVAFKAAVELVTSGYLDYPGVDGIDRLTSELIPVVEGTFTVVPLDAKNLSSGEPGDIVAKDGSLVQF